MPRNFKLTWQAGNGGRNGRWRKIYRGQPYYFAGGRGKSDREAYEAALAAWELMKVKLDAQCPREHELDYRAELETWEKVLAWSNKHFDRAMAECALEKVRELRMQLEQPS